MNIKQGQRAYYRNAPATALASIDAPQLQVSTKLEGVFEYIHLFTTTQNDLDTQLRKLTEHLAPTGRLWVSWPKAGQLETDLAIASVIRIGYTHSLVESTCLRIDDVWSGLKFTHPKPGKSYNNSYGTLPSQQD